MDTSPSPDRQLSSQRIQKPITVLLPYGMNGSPKAFRPHLVDSDWSSVIYYPGRPELTRYKIRWLCGGFSGKYKPSFLRELPAGVMLCRACQVASDNRGVLKSTGISLDYRRWGKADSDRFYSVMQGGFPLPSTGSAPF